MTTNFSDPFFIQFKESGTSTICFFGFNFNIFNTTFLLNENSRGAAIFIDSASNLFILNIIFNSVYFLNNFAYVQGGAFFFSYGINQMNATMDKILCRNNYGALSKKQIKIIIFTFVTRCWMWIYKLSVSCLLISNKK